MSQSKQSKPKNEIPAKCIECAQHKMPWVHEHHNQPRDPTVEVDVQDDRYCYNKDLCRSRRHHAKNFQRINLNRNRKSRTQKNLVEIPVPPPDLLYGILIVYRPAGVDTPVHAIAAEIWNSHGQYGFIEARHCEGMSPSGLEAHVQEFVDEMYAACGLRKFSLEVEREVHECQIRPCAYHSAGRA